MADRQAHVAPLDLGPKQLPRGRIGEADYTLLYDERGLVESIDQGAFMFGYNRHGRHCSR